MIYLLNALQAFVGLTDVKVNIAHLVGGPGRRQSDGQVGGSAAGGRTGDRMVGELAVDYRRRVDDVVAEVERRITRRLEHRTVDAFWRRRRSEEKSDRRSRAESRNLQSPLA